MQEWAFWSPCLAYPARVSVPVGGCQMAIKSWNLFGAFSFTLQNFWARGWAKKMKKTSSSASAKCFLLILWDFFVWACPSEHKLVITISCVGHRPKFLCLYRCVAPCFGRLDILHVLVMNCLRSSPVFQFSLADSVCLNRNKCCCFPALGVIVMLICIELCWNLCSKVPGAVLLCQMLVKSSLCFV